MNLKKKKYWKFILPPIVAGKIVLIVLVLGSAKSEPTVVPGNPEYTPVFIPEQVSFAGEAMDLGRFDIYEALDRELLSNSYFHSQTLRYIKLAPRYFSVIEPILKENNIPDDFKYLMVAESGFDPRAVSPARAVGLWQFLKGTAKDFGLEVNNEVDERYHVEKSTHAACRYLKDSYEKFGSWTMVAASYNRGMNGIERQIERQKSSDYYDLLLNPETQRYVYRIVALKLILQNPEQYSFKVKEKDKYSKIPVRIVEINTKVESFADFAKENGISYKLLKDFNPWLRESYLSNAQGKKYVVSIPLL